MKVSSGSLGVSPYVVASLSPEFAAKVHNLLLQPLNENLHDVLKEQLVTRKATSEQQQLQQLLISEKLGDQKPTQLLRKDAPLS